MGATSMCVPTREKPCSQYGCLAAISARHREELAALILQNVPLSSYLWLVVRRMETIKDIAQIIFYVSLS